MFASAQPLCTMKQYTLADGYTQGSVNEILQDKNGLIWIATRDGLSQFDGYTFKNIKSYPGDKTLMGSSDISSIDENSLGDIWCRNKDGKAYLFDVRTKIFYDVLKGIEPSDDRVNPVADIVTLRKAITWIIYKNGDCFRINDALCKSGKGIQRQAVKGKTIFLIRQDSDGDEWVLTDKGISIIGKKQFNDSTTILHYLELNGTFWLSDGRNKLLKYDKHSGNIESVQLPSDLNDMLFVRSINKDTLAIGTSGNGLYLYSISRESFKQISVNVAKGAPNEVFTIFEDHIGDFWMTNRQSGIIHYEKSSEKVSILHSPDSPVLNLERPNKSMLIENKHGTIWAIPRGENLCYFDRDEQKLKYYFSDTNDPSSIISPAVRYHFYDYQGNIWIDNTQTLAKLSFFDIDFNLVPKENDEIEIRSFLLDQNKKLWVGAKNGKLRILNEKDECIGYVSETGKVTSEPQLFGYNVYSMMEDNNGDIWIGTRLHGLFRFRPKKQKEYNFEVEHFTNDTADDYSLSNNNIFGIFQDSHNRIWVCTYGGGLNLIEQDENGRIRFVHSGNLLKNYPLKTSPSVRSISEPNQETLLVGTTNGLISFSSNFKKPEDIQFYRNTRKSDDASSLISNDVMYIYTDKNGEIYVLTENGGINQIVSENLLTEQMRFRSFTERDGLLSDQTLSMIEDTNDQLWLISSQVISKFFPDQKKVEHFSGSRYRQIFNFSPAAPILNAQGNLIIGTNKGILEINTNKERKYNLVPSVIFTELYIQGAKFKESVQYIDTLALQPSQRNLSLQFAALDYRDSKEIHYSYLMEGIDKEWNYSGNSRSANYINLPHGSYHFKVKSTNSEGVWVDNVRTLAIIAKPKFIETIWAWLVIAILAIVLIQIIVYLLFTFYRLRHDVKMEQKISDLKLNFFTEISHELRTPLTLITSPVAELLENEPLSEVAKNHLTIVKNNTDRMLRMMNQILDFRKIQFNKMTLLIEEVEILSYIALIMDGFLLIAKEKKINFQLKADQKQIYLWIDKDKFEKIIFNLISNAFKYSPQGKSIIIRVIEEDEKINVSVIDQGVGIMAKKIDSIFQ